MLLLKNYRLLLAIAALVFIGFPLILITTSAPIHHHHHSEDNNNHINHDHSSHPLSSSQTRNRKIISSNGDDAANVGSHHHHQEQEDSSKTTNHGNQHNIHHSDIDESFSSTRLLFFDTAIGRLSNQLLTITAAVALANTMNRIAVIPPLFLGGGKGGGGSRVVPVTEIFNLDEWKVSSTKSSSKESFTNFLYCEPRTTDATTIASSPKTRRLCFYLESEIGSAKSDFWNLYRQRHPILTSSKKKVLSDSSSSSVSHMNYFTIGCLKMKGVSNHPLRRKTRPSDLLNCNDNTIAKLEFVASKKRLQDVMVAASRLHDSQILFAPLTMYVSDVLEPLVIRAWGMLKNPQPSVFAELRKKCRKEVVAAGVGDGEENNSNSHDSTAAVTTIAVGIHLRALEGSCRDRIKQVIKEAPLLTDNVAAKSSSIIPADGEETLESHCKMTSRTVLDIIRISRDTSSDKHLQAAKRVKYAVFVADDGQQDPKLRQQFFDEIKRGLSSLFDVTSASVKSLSSSCHKFLDEIIDHHHGPASSSSTPPPWILSSDGAAKGTLALMSDFWQLVDSDIFIGNQLSTVSVNICRMRLAKGKSCQNFVRPKSAAVGKLKWSIGEIVNKYEVMVKKGLVL